MSRVSVVIPTYNRAHLLSRTIESVVRQTRAADEIIIIDDGSTDDTAGVVAQFGGVRLLRQDNRGISAARNAGIQASNSEWIAFLDSDDEWHAEKLEVQMTMLARNNEYRFAHCNEIWIRDGRELKQLGKHRKRGGHIFEHCLPLCCISPSAVVIHRDVFAHVGTFDESFPVCEDYDLWLRICSQYPVLFIDKRLLIKYGGHPDQLSAAHWGMDRYRIRALQKMLNRQMLDAGQRIAVLHMLLEKLKIYLNGAKKRNNSQYVQEFNKLLQDCRKQLAQTTPDTAAPLAAGRLATRFRVS